MREYFLSAVELHPPKLPRDDAPSSRLPSNKHATPAGQVLRKPVALTPPRGEAEPAMKPRTPRAAHDDNNAEWWRSSGLQINADQHALGPRRPMPPQMPRPAPEIDWRPIVEGIKSPVHSPSGKRAASPVLSPMRGASSSPTPPPSRETKHRDPSLVSVTVPTPPPLRPPLSPPTSRASSAAKSRPGSPAKSTTDGGLRATTPQLLLTPRATRLFTDAIPSLFDARPRPSSGGVVDLLTQNGRSVTAPRPSPRPSPRRATTIRTHPQPCNGPCSGRTKEPELMRAAWLHAVHPVEHVIRAGVRRSVLYEEVEVGGLWVGAISRSSAM